MKTTGIILIMRGIPGSGKSTFVNQKYSHATVCSADHYFTDEKGNYTFDIEKIGEAHQHCKHEFKEAIEFNERLIVIDNTNLSMQAMYHYIKKAEERQYEVWFVRMMTPVDIAIERNIHKVPPETIKHFADIMEDIPKEYQDREIKIKAY